jgi:hypothetical protein
VSGIGRPFQYESPHDPLQSFELLHTGRSKIAERSFDSAVIAARCRRNTEQWVETSLSECRIRITAAVRDVSAASVGFSGGLP